MLDDPLKPYCDKLVVALYGQGKLEEWWGTPNPAFGGITPITAFREYSKVVYDHLFWEFYGIRAGQENKDGNV